jgi:hypothetical protein
MARADPVCGDAAHAHEAISEEGVGIDHRSTLPGPAAGSGGACDPVWFIGARGSGEWAAGDHGMGAPVGHMASVVAKDVAAKGMAMTRTAGLNHRPRALRGPVGGA